MSDTSTKYQKQHFTTQIHQPSTKNNTTKTNTATNSTRTKQKNNNKATKLKAKQKGTTKS